MVLAVTVVLLPVGAGEDYSGSSAARLQPGRLVLLIGAAITSFGVGASGQVYHINFLNTIHLFN
jgi:hypothetical protein